MRQFELLTKERPLDVDLRSLCGDLSEEYDAPKTSPSVTSLMTKRKLKRFPFRTAMVAMGILALVIIGALFTTRRLERTGIPKRIAPRSQRPAPIAGALKAPARLDRRAAHDTSAANARQVAKLSGRTIKKQAPVPPVEDSLQALLDSFNVLSPEPSGARGSLLKETALPSPAAPKADKKASAPSDSGRLFVYCDPWATVYADDRELGTTPFKSAVSLPAGVHIIKLTNSFCTPLIDTVTVSADTVIRKRYHLEVKQ